MSGYEALEGGGDSPEWPPVSDNRRSSHRRWMLVTGVLLSACAAVALLGLWPVKKQVQLAQDSVGQNLLAHPTWNDMMVFEKGAQEVLTKLGMNTQSDQPRNELQVSCGVMAWPCMQNVGRCIAAQMEGSELANASIACDCLLETQRHPIQVPGFDRLALICAVPCVEKIRDIFDRRLMQEGHDTKGMPCLDTVRDMEMGAYGSARSGGAIHVDDDVDAEGMWAVDDPKVNSSAAALLVYVNSQRASRCPGKGLYTGYSVDAAWGTMITEGHHMFLMEVRLGDVEYAARVSHKQNDQEGIAMDHEGDPSDPYNLLGEYEVSRVVPDPCGDAKLALTRRRVDLINAQSGNTWQAGYKLSSHFGKTTSDSFKHGSLMTPEVKKARMSRLFEWDVTGFVPPKEYDASRYMQGGLPCQTTKILNQGSCGSCFAFAAATMMSYRLCMMGTGWDVELSAQEVFDCADGTCAAGGEPINAMERATVTPMVPTWCDPYRNSKLKCGDTCSKSVKFYAKQGTTRTVGMFNPEAAQQDGTLEKKIKWAELQMQKEILEHGPVSVTFQAFDDFIAYKSGIYQVTKRIGSSEHAGGHAVALIGWGIEVVNGVEVPYWKIQNSWGEGWGERGFGRFIRGKNDALIESWGIDSVEMLSPSACPQLTCMNGGEKTADCNCLCRGKWSGADCNTCGLSCGAGVVAKGLCECSCPPGTVGQGCDNVFKVDTFSSCMGEGSAKVTVSWNTPTVPQNKGALFAFYPKGTTAVFSKADMWSRAVWNDEGSMVLCGNHQFGLSSVTACPPTGSISISPPNKVGEYDMYIVPFIVNVGLPVLLNQGIRLGGYSVLPSTCTPEQKAAKQKENDAVAAWLETTVKSSGTTVKSSASGPALSSAAAAAPVSSLEATDNTQAVSTQTPSLIIQNIGKSSVLWIGGARHEVCWSLPASVNAKSKHLELFTASQNATIGAKRVPWGLGAYDEMGKLPADPVGCVELVVASLGDLHDGLFRVALVAKSDAATEHDTTVLAQTEVFLAAEANVRFATGPVIEKTAEGTFVSMSIEWDIHPARQAQANDVVKIYNQDNTVVDWFFTSCGCKTNTEGMDPRAKGTVHETWRAAEPPQAYQPLNPSSAIADLAKKPRSYSLKLVKGGSDTVIAIDEQWIDWAKYTELNQ